MKSNTYVSITWKCLECIFGSCALLTPYIGDWWLAIKSDGNWHRNNFPLIFVLTKKCSCCQIVSEGNDEGSMLFLPPGIANMILGKRNIDYYDKIKLVINRLEERQNIEEGKIFDLFRNEVRIDDDDMLASRPKRGTGRPRLGVSRPSREVEEIDTSWKDGRCLYPKRSSQVGAGYQVAIIPRAGTIVTERQLDEPK